MNPSTTILLIRLNIARAITTTPADLKNRGAYLEREKDTELNDNRANTVSVPKANENIMKNPDMNDPLERAAICMA